MTTYGVMRTKYKKSGKVIPRYTKEGIIVPNEMVPKDIQKLLENESKVTDDATRCIMCLGLATHTRFADMQVVDLCEECFYNRRMGEVIQALRKSKEYEHAKRSRQAKKPKDDEKVQKERKKDDEEIGVLTHAKVEEDSVATKGKENTAGQISARTSVDG